MEFSSLPSIPGPVSNIDSLRSSTVTLWKHKFKQVSGKKAVTVQKIKYTQSNKKYSKINKKYVDSKNLIELHVEIKELQALRWKCYKESYYPFAQSLEQPSIPSIGKGKGKNKWQYFSDVVIFLKLD